MLDFKRDGVDGEHGAQHCAVVCEEVVQNLVTAPGGRYIDGTLGRGGHLRALMEAAGPTAKGLGIDQDDVAIQAVGAQQESWLRQVNLEHGNFADMKAIAEKYGFTHVQGICLDLGVSSPQLDTAERGFSFRMEGPLDMRMDRSRGKSAADLLATVEESELAEILYRYGEERAARRIARGLVRERERAPIVTTGRLAELVERLAGGRRGKLHPATRTFQALRIAVNRELECLQRGLMAAVELLAPGGRLAVISFHSLEDRMVKQFARAHEGRHVALAAGGSCWEGTQPRLYRITRKPLRANDGEVQRNPRARSARLRVMERASSADTEEDGHQEGDLS